LSKSVDARHCKPGDELTARVTQDVKSDGKVVIAKGSKLVGHVTEAKANAAEFCGTKDIRQASREQIQSFIAHLAESATKDRDGLICKLNSYSSDAKAGAA
jgi:hypothetical protein